ncbi:response regulator transcription factor [Deinococcus metallilatus]|uniref:DNA-binding NarL/FixJ family response regulator n=1 Tax=Deinococcus metallilatus TaxID=1211322 RepID=A0AAJ5F2Y7_9DEIO|nr:response regulator transcription factor [Deinococcus metallilatus]MBB5296677.1 DNA-binding NarL/FixJ family response regulator [Deinococcus metallilatus]QBY09237.1 response regulator transcription factor [Deinococcus metallilatus]RXJ09758.1 response regulator transcription factor [Deinococcus metallilatus]TLK24223.1 response regulator transcription factor [Deinococcus metallilatus]
MVPASTLPTVQLALLSPLVGAGIRALLAGVGVRVVEEGGAVLVVDDAWLGRGAELAEAGAVVAVGSVAWAGVLPEVASGGWAALPADATPAELLAGVLGASAGLAVLPPTLLPPPPLSTEEDEEENLPLAAGVTLTPRERDVLALLAEGLSNKRAARELGVTESTVKFHVQAVYSKLGVQSRAGAVTRGIQLGLLSV